jgi:hypothetical protein
MGLLAGVDVFSVNLMSATANDTVTFIAGFAGSRRGTVFP